MPTEESSAVESDVSSSEASVAEAAALTAAAEAAMASEGGEEASPVTDKGSEAIDKALAAKTLAAPEKTGPTLAQRLRRRENEQRIKDEATRMSRESTLAIEQERRQFAAKQAEIETERKSLSEMQARYKAASSDPMKLAELSGMTREKLAHELAMSGSPEHMALMELRAKADALEAKHREVDEFIAGQKKREEESTRANREQSIRQGEQQYVSVATNSEKFPALNTLYEPHEILAKGKAVQEAYYKKTGSVATDAEIAEYLEINEARPRLDKIRQGSAGSVIATKSKANGPRTLSATGASERRATPKRIEQLSDKEERAALMAIAEEAMRTAS